MAENKPLVSIIVITYNSANYVLETLESAKAQTYQNIELIITDDASTDETVAICKGWLITNKQSFKRAKVITVGENTGIPANCNRGVLSSKGDWIKLIAGDDILLDNCIEDNVTYVQKYNNSKFLFSRFSTIDEKGSSFRGNEINYFSSHSDFFHLNVAKQYQRLVEADRIAVPAPTSFLKRKTIINLGSFDEEIRLCEDYPMWLKATKNKIKLEFLDEVTVAYRIHSKSLTNEQSKFFGFEMRRIFLKYRFNYLLKNNFILAIDLWIRYVIRPYPILNKSIRYLLPLTYVNYFKRKLLN